MDQVQNPFRYLLFCGECQYALVPEKDADGNAAAYICTGQHRIQALGHLGYSIKRTKVMTLVKEELRKEQAELRLLHKTLKALPTDSVCTAMEDAKRRILSNLSRQAEAATEKIIRAQKDFKAGLLEQDIYHLQIEKLEMEKAIMQGSSAELQQQIDELRRVLSPDQQYNQLQRKARKSNIPIPDLPRWDATKVVNLLRNPVYKGTLVCRKTTVIIPSSHKTRKTDPSEQYVFDDSHEAIVTAEEFDQVQVRFPHQERKAPRKLNDYPLRSVVFCGVCKRAMHRYQLARGDDGARYYCRSAQLTNTPCTNKKYSEKELEHIILQSLLPMLQMIQASVGHRRSNQDQVQNMLGQCQQELREAGAMEKKLRLEKLEIYEAYIAGTLSVQTYRQKKNELTRRGKVISERLTQLQDQEATLKNGITSTIVFWCTAVIPARSTWLVTAPVLI